MTRTSSNHRASERASIAHAPLPPLAELLAPRVYGAEDGGLGYQDLLGTPDAMVYITGQTLYFDAAATAELFWGGVSVATVPVAAGDFRTPTFAVPGARIAGTRNPIDDGYSGDGEHLVTYSYIYAGGRDDSAPATVRVKCSLPGGEDPVGATRDINENLAAPTITPSPVPDDPNIIVRVTFPRWKNIAAGDVVTVDWAGYKYPLPAITDPDQPQLPFATLLYDDIVRAGGGEHVPVSYYIYDVAGNWSKYAPYADPSVEIDPGTLTAPQLAEAVDNLLDLSQLGDADCTVRVGTRPLNPIDSVTVHWTSSLAGGGKKEYTFGPVGFDENNDPGTLLFTVPNAVALEAASGSLAIHYTALAGTSKTRRYRVSELAEVKLPAPIVPAANGSELDPFTGTPRDIEIHVPFDAKQMFQGDSVTMYVVGTRGAVTRYWEDAITLSSGDLQDPISFYCPADVLQAVENGAATFRYVVSSPKLATRGSFGIQATSRESEMLTLQIRRAGAQPDLPPPIVVDLTDGVLNPELSRTRVQIPNSAATLPGKDVTLNWSGKVPYITQGTIPSSGLLEITINKPYIEGNKDSEVTVTYTIDGKTSEALTFFVGEQGLDLPAPTIVEAPANILNPFDVPSTGITLSIPYPLEPTDLVTATFGSYETSGKPGASDLTFLIPPGEVAKVLGTAVPVSYTVIRDGKRYDSKVLTLNVLAIRDGDANLPIPAIDKANGNTLDLGSFTGNPKATVIPWALIAVGQKVWLRIHGTLANGRPDTIVLLNGVNVTQAMVNNGLSQAIARARLEALMDGSITTVECKVNFNGGSEADAVAFPQREYRIDLTLPIPAAPFLPDFPSNVVDINDPAIDRHNGLRIVVPRYDGVSQYEFVGLRVEGNLGGTWSALNENVPRPPQAITLIMPKAELLKIHANGSRQLRSFYLLYGGELPDTGIPSRDLTATFSSVAPPTRDFEDFESAPNGVVSPPVVLPGLTFVSSTSGVIAFQNGVSTPPLFFGMRARIGTGTTYLIDFHKSYRSVQFAYSQGTATSTVARFYDEQMVPIGDLRIPPDNGTGGTFIRYSAPTAQMFRFMDISATGVAAAMLLDTFTMTQ